MANYKYAGDRAILIEFENKISPEINEKVRKLDLAINQSMSETVLETIPAYHSILVYYDPLKVNLEELLDDLKDLESFSLEYEINQPRELEIPVIYGGEFGPDLDYVAEYNNLTPEEVIDKHSSIGYRVYMLGFTPGFPYLGGLPEQLATPRHKDPRGKILAGSVGIAGGQTGIYPITSPGGWRIIGRTPYDLFKPDSDEPFLFQQGDLVKFKKIDSNEYEKIKTEFSI